MTMLIIMIIIIIALLDYQTVYQEIFEENAPEISLLVAAKTAKGGEKWGGCESLQC
jgi:hypothetical protein